jgi:hypothetical protein
MNRGGLTFETRNALTLAESLAHTVLDLGLGALSKTDLYDYILYLLDVHSNEHFFTQQTNQQNALLLKASPAKIKASKLNIYLKFDTGDRQNGAALSRFIRQIADKKIRLDGDGKEFLRLTVEDPVVRFCLDTVLKNELGTSADVKLNSEIIVLKKTDFYHLFRYIVKNSLRLNDAERAALLEQAAHEKTAEEVRAFLRLILDTTVEIAGSLPFVPAESIREGLVALTIFLKSRMA